MPTRNAPTTAHTDAKASDAVSICSVPNARFPASPEAVRHPHWHNRKKVTAATGNRVTAGVLSTQMAMTSSTRTPTSRMAAETETETASSF